MTDPLGTVDLRRSASVCETLRRGTEANLGARCRRGSIDVLPPDEPVRRLIATGDLHDHPEALSRLTAMAGMGDAGATPTAHVTLHEVVHSDRLMNGMDFSYRALVKVAALKAAFPEHVHTLLANHELSQIIGAGIVKDGVPVVQAFNDGVDYVFGDDAPHVLDEIGRFIRSMPLALRVVGGARAQAWSREGLPTDLLCAHSLPSPELMDRLDPGVLSRDLTEEDYAPRRGSAHLMVWGRGHRAEHLEALGRAWDVGGFILGHEKAEEGWMIIEPCGLVLNTDDQRATVADLDLTDPVDVGALRVDAPGGSRLVRLHGAG
jgi:hypothetical protein